MQYGEVIFSCEEFLKLSSVRRSVAESTALFLRFRTRKKNESDCLSLYIYIIDLFVSQIGWKLTLSFPQVSFFRSRSYGYAPSKMIIVVENSPIFSPIWPPNKSIKRPNKSHTSMLFLGLEKDKKLVVMNKVKNATSLFKHFLLATC